MFQATQGVVDRLYGLTAGSRGVSTKAVCHACDALYPSKAKARCQARPGSVQSMRAGYHEGQQAPAQREPIWLTDLLFTLLAQASIPPPEISGRDLPPKSIQKQQLVHKEYIFF
ncbi:hypothetical protein [Pseudomonas sp. AG1028]|uniref:hypothetical protein n=1 Tax=Pseudomonas sp. AG1028 TaxID=2572911 RepID=UPI0011BF7EE8|nr:hypothetical protein [Pseudomonas sp. AG1028]